MTVEDLEKKPRKVVEIVTPLENQSVKYGEPLELSVRGTKDKSNFTILCVSAWSYQTPKNRESICFRNEAKSVAGKIWLLLHV